MADTVFLHGWGLSGVVWAETVAVLRGEDSPVKAPALHPDLPGYGEAATLSPYSAESLADALAASIATPINLVGWSMGGMVALALAARHPDKVARLVLVGTSPAFAARADWPHGMTPEVLDEFARALALDFRATLLRFLSLQARGGDAARAVIVQLRARMQAQAEPNPEVLAAGLELLRTVDLRDQVEQVRCPTLVMHGAYDTLCAPEAGAWLAEHLPNGRLALHERASHAPFLSHPDWFVATLKEFLHG
ncbi:MAG: pimeloyl-ACP methyl ester esterase BioH [Pseudomonadota bacterium]|nr:pimeloyl-ACP methyl ester esterase BioH [Pseudomonadota bacterium]